MFVRLTACWCVPASSTVIRKLVIQSDYILRIFNCLCRTSSLGVSAKNIQFQLSVGDIVWTEIWLLPTSDLVRFLLFLDERDEHVLFVGSHTILLLITWGETTAVGTRSALLVTLALTLSLTLTERPFLGVVILVGLGSFLLTSGSRWPWTHI